MTLKTTFVALQDGTSIAVPDDIRKMSNFVLREQGDWFEDEIHFVRRLIEPGMHALDIGANYGLYACAMLKKMDGLGHLWCFEPTSDTAYALSQTFERNGHQKNVTLLELGLSNREGSAAFYTSVNSELNSLSKVDENQHEGLQTIQLTTLDACLKSFNWTRLDFIKLDAEGEEVKIIQAGQVTLQQLSPLVMFELKHGDSINHDLIQAFSSLNYEIFRLIPGLNALAPATLSEGFDSFQLNLFACQPERAVELQKRGLLISKAKPLPCAVPLQLEQFPALATSTGLRLSPQGQGDTVYFSMLSAFLASQNQSLPLLQRYQHLLFAFETLQPQLDAKEERIERLASMARVAFEFGARNLGSTILDFVTKRHFQGTQTISVQDVFVQASAPMDSLPVAGNPVQWLCAGVLDGLIRKHAYSCYFTGPKMIPLMQKLEQGAYLHPDIARRIVAMRDLIDAIQQSPPDE